jgi:hypothetical protein
VRSDKKLPAVGVERYKGLYPPLAPAGDCPAGGGVRSGNSGNAAGFAGDKVNEGLLLRVLLPLRPDIQTR